MTLKLYYPKPPLAEHVDMFWCWEGYHPPHAKERILPHGVMELTINLTDKPFHFYYPEDGFLPRPVYGPVVAGSRSEYFLVDTSQSASILAVYFKPGGALPFFGASGAELLNQHLSLDLFWGNDAHRFYDQLLEARTDEKRFALLEAVLTKRLLQSKERHRAVNYALNKFLKNPHQLSIAQVVDEIALSQTRFIQLFKEETGITPKVFCRVRRFQKTLERIVNKPDMSWTDIALESGYFDQAHFINEFQHFSGITPTMYAPQDIAHYSNLPVIEEFALVK